MGLLYTIKKPQSILPTKCYTYSIESIISENEYQALLILIVEAKKSIDEDITIFSSHTFTKNSDEKKSMNFKIARVFCGSEPVGYSIGYCELGDPANFLIDIVFIKEDHRNHNLAYNLLILLINSISSITTIENIKLITQDQNSSAKKLILKVMEVVENSIN